MKKSAAVFGVGTGINGQEAAMRAAQRALNQLGALRPALGLVFASQELNLREALAGLTALLGETPLWGFSTTRPLAVEGLTSAPAQTGSLPVGPASPAQTGSLASSLLAAGGEQPRSVVVALLAGDGFKAQSRWFSNQPSSADGLDGEASPARGSTAPAALLDALRESSLLPKPLLVAAVSAGGLEDLCASLVPLGLRACGGVAAGDLSLGNTICLGGGQAGADGLSAALLGGRLCAGVGEGHGWASLGMRFQVTRASDVWVRALDGAPAVDVFACCFGFSPREWAFSPLNEMARLYPLGVETCGGPSSGAPLTIRSPQRVEVDGSLRMSAPVPEGAYVRLMTGIPQACLDAIRSSAAHALAALQGARPLMGVLLVDAAWSMLFEGRQSEITAAARAALGGLPVVGGYTFAQISPSAALLNQHIQVIVFGESAGE
jgi:hypothetical protein